MRRLLYTFAFIFGCFLGIFLGNNLLAHPREIQQHSPFWLANSLLLRTG